MTVVLHTGDCRAALRALPDNSIHCVVTSPPYFGLRDYGSAEQIGLEKTPRDYVAQLVEVFREVRRVLRPDGVAWLNLGDSYCTRSARRSDGKRTVVKAYAGEADMPKWRDYAAAGNARYSSTLKGEGLKDKDLIGIPWRVAFALQDDGWYLRSDIVWHKPNVMPESVKDRPTRCHEYVFLLTKSARYYYDAEAVKEPAVCPRKRGPALHPDAVSTNGNGGLARREPQERRSRRTVWTIATAPYRAAHFATFPPALVEPMILAGTSEAGCCAACGTPWRRIVERTPMIVRHGPKAGSYGSRTTDGLSGTMLAPATAQTTGWSPSCECGASTVPCTVLDPFAGSGTTLAVAAQHGRDAVGIELNADYVELAVARVREAAPSTLIKLFQEHIDKVS